MATTTRRAALSTIRRRQRPGDAALSLDAGDSALAAGLSADDDVHDSAVGSDLRRRLVDGFARLGERCRELLGLLWQDRLSYQEIADSLGIAIGSVGPTRIRCLAQLRTLSGVEP